MAEPELAPKPIDLPDRAGIRLKDAEYSSNYVLALRHWMRESGQIRFEDELIKDGFISLDFSELQLGLDFIMESVGPKEDMEFEVGSIKYVALDPEDQIPKRIANESQREAKRERYVASMGLSQSDISHVSLLGNRSEIGQSTLGIFRIPEPPYSDICRNKPQDLRISHLRRLREDGYFDGREMDVQIAAYLISKGHWSHHQITTFFSHVITWDRFRSAQSKVHHHIQRTWPDRFNRVELAKEQLTKKQLLAFETRHDVDLFPTLKRTAEILGIGLSALNERLSHVREQFRAEFKEFWKLKRRPSKWSQYCDIQEGGFFRKSLDYFRTGLWTNNLGEAREVSSSIHIHKNIHTFEENKYVYDKLRQRIYPPELKAVIGSANRGMYGVRRGEYFHHVEEWKFITLWKKIYYLSEYSDEETSVFTKFILKRNEEDVSIFSMRRRLRVARTKLRERGYPYGRFARKPIERSQTLVDSNPVASLGATDRPAEKFEPVPHASV